MRRSRPKDGLTYEKQQRRKAHPELSRSGEHEQAPFAGAPPHTSTTMADILSRSRPLKEPASLDGIAPLFYTRDQLALALATSARTIDNWRERGVIPFIKVGGIVRFDVARVRAALERKFEVHEVHVPKRRPRKQPAEPAEAASK